MAIMKEHWEKSKLPLKDDDKDILRYMEKVKNMFDKKKRNKRLKEEDKAEYLASLNSTTLNMAPLDWEKRILGDNVLPRDWKKEKIALLADYIGPQATR